MLIDHCAAEHLEDAYTSLKTESSSYVSQQSCSSGEKDISLRLLVSIQLLYKALIETLWFCGWQDVSCAPVRGLSLFPWKSVFCSLRWAASTGAASVWCRHSDGGKSNHLYLSDLQKTFLWIHMGFDIKYDSLAQNRRDGDICKLKVRWNVNLKVLRVLQKILLLFLWWEDATVFQVPSEEEVNIVSLKFGRLSNCSFWYLNIGFITSQPLRLLWTRSLPVEGCYAWFD